MFNTRVSCHNKNHTLLHITRLTQSVNGMSVKNRIAVAQGNSTAQVIYVLFIQVQAQNHILLATTIVEIQNKSGQYIPCRALLDSASQSHFITERCAQLLRLSTIQTHASVMGISNVNTATHQFFHTVNI